MRTLAEAVGEGGDEWAPQTRERLLSGIPAGELERRGAETPSSVLAEVKDESVLGEGGQQVIDGRARQLELASDG